MMALTAPPPAIKNLPTASPGAGCGPDQEGKPLHAGDSLGWPWLLMQNTSHGDAMKLNRIRGKCSPAGSNPPPWLRVITHLSILTHSRAWNHGSREQDDLLAGRASGLPRAPRPGPSLTERCAPQPGWPQEPDRESTKHNRGRPDGRIPPNPDRRRAPRRCRS